jgi:uncharacterized protein (DUF1697 family)
MFRYIVLLRVVNVGGTGKIAMSDLRSLCEEVGCREVRTYIASGNVVLTSPLSPAELKAAVEARLASHLGKPLAVAVRSPEDLTAVLAANPFPDIDPARCMICFLDVAPPADTLDHLRHVHDERVALGRCELYIAYPGGMGKSRLVVPAAKTGTLRNINTVKELLKIASGC